jgi:hypothetical protein
MKTVQDNWGLAPFQEARGPVMPGQGLATPN